MDAKTKAEKNKKPKPAKRRKHKVLSQFKHLRYSGTLISSEFYLHYRQRGAVQYLISTILDQCNEIKRELYWLMMATIMEVKGGNITLCLTVIMQMCLNHVSDVHGKLNKYKKR